MNNNRVYDYLVPEKVLKILPALEENPPFKNFHIDNLKIILSIICTHYRKDDNDNFYSQLMLKYLRNRVWNADQYVNFLFKENIIRRIGGYVKNNHSYRYQFTSAYLSPFVKTEMMDQKILRKISKANSKDKRKFCMKYPMQNATIKGLTVNYETAEKIINEKCQDNINELNYAIGAITRIKNKLFYTIVDEAGHRLHTNLTNLPKFLRSEVRINGEELSGVDIRNSQPYMAVKYLLNPESAKQFFPDPDKYPLMMLKCLRLTEQQDVKQYQLLTSKARFYKYLETEFNKRGCHYPVISEDRVSDELKNKVFQILFDKNHHASIEKKIFHELFPSVDKAFSVLRMSNYTNFVNSLARMESYVILDVILDYLNKEYPKMIATEIYDNITTSKAIDDISTTSRVMTKELTEFVGVPPTLKVEVFSTDSSFT